MKYLPYVLPWVAYALATGVLNLVFAKHTDEDLVEMAEKRPVFAWFVKVVRGLGFDPVEPVHFARTTAQRFARAPSGVAVKLLAMLGLILVACTPAKSPPTSADYRGYVALADKGVRSLDQACSDVVGGMSDKVQALALAKDCSAVAHDAEDALLAADSALDSYDAGKASQVLCLLSHAAQGLDALLGIVQAHAGKVPALLTDVRTALEVAGAYGVATSCPVVATYDGGK